MIHCTSAGWTLGKLVFPLPSPFPKNHNLCAKLNAKWDLNWNKEQWPYKFKATWALSKHIKKTLFALAYTSWSSLDCFKIGMSNGLHPRCKIAIQDIKQLLYNCPNNQKYFNLLGKFVVSLHCKTFKEHDVLWGECPHLDILLGHNLRSNMLFNIWKESNSAWFKGSCLSQFFEFLIEARVVDLQARSGQKEALEEGITLGHIMGCNIWKT